MEMPPDTLKSVGVNELFVAVVVEASFTTEQAAFGSLDSVILLERVGGCPHNLSSS